MPSYRATLCAQTLSDLGISGFTDWLTRSFCDSLTGPELGQFHFEEDDFFGRVFASVYHEFSEDQRKQVRDALEAALERFSATKSNFENLYNLVAIAEVAKPNRYLAKIAEIFTQWIPIQPAEDNRQSPTKPLVSETEIYCLRETLEVAFRCLLKLKKGESDSDIEEQLITLGKWCYDIFAKRPGLRALVPAWAPMFVLANYVASIQFAPEERIEVCSELVNIFNSGFLTLDDPAPAFFTYKEGVRLFPYACSSVLSKLNEWIPSDIFAELPEPFQRPLSSSHSMPSATHGIGDWVDPETVMEDQNRELESADFSELDAA